VLSRVAEFVRTNSPNNTRLLVWGSDANLYRLTQRLPASRYFYAYPLMTGGIANAHRVEDFVMQVNAYPPDIIADEGNEQLPPLAPAARAAWRPAGPGFVLAPGALEQFYALVEARYVPTQSIGAWRIYRRRTADEYIPETAAPDSAFARFTAPDVRAQEPGRAGQAQQVLPADRLPQAASQRHSRRRHIR
jgi:hypothetical protein